MVGARVNDPATFVTALFGSAKGRIAYLYDVVGHLDGPRAAFALGLWLPDRAARLERFQALLMREQGILLVTGPTGSGKTTTLNYMVDLINTQVAGIVTEGGRAAGVAIYLREARSRQTGPPGADLG